MQEIGEMVQSCIISFLFSHFLLIGAFQLWPPASETSRDPVAHPPPPPTNDWLLLPWWLLQQMKRVLLVLGQAFQSLHPG